MEVVDIGNSHVFAYVRQDSGARILALPVALPVPASRNLPCPTRWPLPAARAWSARMTRPGGRKLFRVSDSTVPSATAMIPTQP